MFRSFDSSLQRRTGHSAGRSPAWLLLMLFLTQTLLMNSPSVKAQDAEKADDKKPKIPAPETKKLLTKDGVSLNCRFYPGTRKKDSVPIMLIHGWEERGSQYAELALSLQKRGHAVIVPDLRGHGLSTKRRTPQGFATIRRDRMNKQALMAMWMDLEACKSFLRKQNNEGLLNLEQLCLIGSDLGALIALEWAVRDWNAPRLPTLKQGQDVKALVLISPPQSFKGLTAQAAYTHPQVSRLSTLIITGKENTRAFSDARRVYNRFEKARDKLPKSQKESLFNYGCKTTKQSADLFAKGIEPDPLTLISNFVLLRLEKRKADFPWTDRTNPFNESK
ncbi:MAG: alpha/beta fold hydrolase [Pirellulaceae bacterium]